MKEAGSRAIHRPSLPIDLRHSTLDESSYYKPARSPFFETEHDLNDVTIVTGPLRSGTSCVTGLLERCGFDLGRNVRVFRDSTEYNPHGHFEIDLLFTINERLLVESPGGPSGVLRPPSAEALAKLAAARERYFRLFIRKFDGELCKDPLFCLTLPFWENRWPELKSAIFCLRHPLATARSMEKRYGVSIADGLFLWHTYTTRFFESGKRHRVFVLDFDAFCQTPSEVFTPLLDWLGRPVPLDEIEAHLDGFFSAKHVHWSFGEDELREVPTHVRELYLELRASSGNSVRT